MRRWNSYWIAIALAFLFATPTFAQHRFENVSLLPQVYPPQPTVGLAANRPLCSFGSPGQISQYYATDTAALSFCTNTGWVAFAGGGGTGTVTSLTATSPVVITPSPTTTTGVISCPTCFTSGSPPTLDQIGNPAAAKTFALGTNLPLAFSTAGVFTNTAMNETVQSVLNSASPSNIWGIGGVPAYFLTDALTGAVKVPLGSTSGFSNGVAGYAQVDDSGATGALGFGAGVGVFGDCYVDVNNGRCWGQNDVVNDKVGDTGNFIIGNELDLGVYNTTTQVIGVVSAAFFHAQPATLADAFQVSFSGGGTTANWLNGFHCNTGSINLNGLSAPPCVRSGQQAAGNNQSSNAIAFDAADNSGAMASEINYLFARHHMLVSPWPYVDWDNGTGNDKTWGVTLTATANLNVHQLVKIDTANANSVVVCTTADIICSAFVTSNVTNSAPLGCSSASNFCGLATMPGSVVSAILGTGTCAIGNWVIVDTTTNGDVKCVTTQPRAWQGFALAANSTVGTAFSILISPGGSAATTVGTLSTTSNCAAVGTAASPSVASCGSAAAGQFSCATNATGATCTVNTTAVTANSEIFVFESDTTTTGTRLGVTCNTGTNVLPTSRLLASSVAATSFTINLGTVTTNPACFSYNIVN